MTATDSTPADFSGWATIEIMGHQQVSGFVQTRAFGATVMFSVSVAAMDPIEQVLSASIVLGYERIPIGSKVRISREASDILIGAASVYRMTRVSEETALARAGQKIEVIELAQEKKELVDDDDPFVTGRW